MVWYIVVIIQFLFNFDEVKIWFIIVSVYLFGSCKEQIVGNVYGKVLVEQGFVVIVYDVSFQGVFGGVLCWIEDLIQWVEDVSCVIDYVVMLFYVDVDRIGVIGVCGGGGYVINVMLIEKCIKVVVSIIGVNIGCLFCEGFSEYNLLGVLEVMVV